MGKRQSTGAVHRRVAAEGTTRHSDLPGTLERVGRRGVPGEVHLREGFGGTRSALPSVSGYEKRDKTKILQNGCQDALTSWAGGLP